MTMLNLYSTQGCHLCEDAEALLLPLLEGQPLQLQIVEISGDDTLLERYGIRIPVLAGFDSRGTWQELGWPFDAAGVALWLAQLDASAPEG